MTFVVRIDPPALQDIQEAIDWYELQKEGLGERFYNYLEKSLKQLELNPYFQIRYSGIRCLSLLTFPFMIHYTIDQTNSIVIVRAVLNTSMSPAKWKYRG